MTRAEKSAAIVELQEVFTNSKNFYITDYASLTVEQINNLRRICFDKGVKLSVLKNTLVKKALEKVSDTEYTELYGALKGPTAIMFSDTANLPGKIIEEFRKKHDKPVLKAAYINSDIYLGDDKVKELSSLKSKEELIGDIVALLQSPMKNVIGSLKSSSNTIAGLVKALQERGE